MLLRELFTFQQLIYGLEQKITHLMEQTMCQNLQT